MQSRPFVRLLALCAALLAGCSPAGTTAAPAATTAGAVPEAAAGGIDVTARLDTELGMVVLPYDRFVPDRADLNELMHAVNIEITLCAREQGIDMVAHPSFPDVDVYHQESFFGPWTAAQAQKYGFVQPMRDADLRANEIVPADYGTPGDPAWLAAADHNEPIAAAHEAELQACSDKAQHLYAAMRAARDTPWQAEIAATETALREGEVFRSAVTDLETCLRDKGLEPSPGEPGYVVGADPRTIDEEQLKLAVQVVDCKDSTQFTSRVADAWAALQAPILSRYEAEVVQQGEANAAALEAARALAAEHPEVLEPSR